MGLHCEIRFKLIQNSRPELRISPDFLYFVLREMSFKTSLVMLAADIYLFLVFKKAKNILLLLNNVIKQQLIFSNNVMERERKISNISRLSGWLLLFKSSLFQKTDLLILHDFKWRSFLKGILV